MGSPKRKIIAIVGPTASGKTSWGVSIAKKHNGEIISADSRQVYRGLDIGTSKDLKDYGEIPYHLIDICEPGVQFTMFDWVGEAKKAIEEIFSRGKTPIIVGGTGLYIQALVEGFELERNNKSKIINNIYGREFLEKQPIKKLQKIFAKLQIENSKIDLDNPYRLIRAIEREQSGEVISKKKPNFEVLQIAVDRPREILYSRIDQGVEEWFEEGFVEEVQGLLNAGVDPKWLEKIGLEYRLLAQFLTQSEKRKAQSDNSKLKTDLEFGEMKSRMKFAIHAYARRQLTWFRRFPEIIWCKDLQSAKKEIKKFLA